MDYAGWNEISDEELLEAYKKNYKRVLPSIRQICDVYHGQVLITADHGNHIGEKAIYGHPGFLASRELREVPFDFR